MQSPGECTHSHSSERLRTLARHIQALPCSEAGAAPESAVPPPSLSWVVVGAGAIGGLVGARLAQAGQTVTLLARRDHLAAMQRNKGILVVGLDKKETMVPIRAVATMEEVGAVDVVVIALKAHQILPVLKDLPRLFHENTIVLTMQNGLPWWYFHKHGGSYEGRPLNSVDPDGKLFHAIPADRIVGCIPYPAAHLRSPGEVVHTEGTLLPLGELDDSMSKRVHGLSAALIAAGFKAPVLESLRTNMWVKLLGNLCFNPIGAMTHSTLGVMATYAPSVDMVRRAMEEASEVASKLGITMDVSIERRIKGAAKVGNHKPSTLQDVEAGKVTEVDALIAAVVELADLTQTPAPTIRTLCACMLLLNKTIEEKKVKIVSVPL